MKPLSIKKIFAASALTLSILAYSGCQQVVYSNIRKEVALEDRTISGDIYSIIRFDVSGEKRIYIANGNIYYKQTSENSYGKWTKAGTNGLTGHVIKLAADSTYLYALTGTTKEDDDDGENVGSDRYIYYSEDGESWKPVILTDFTSDGKITYKDKRYAYLFCTNTIDSANRKTYFNYVDAYSSNGVKACYKLNGSSGEKQTAGSENASTSPCSIFKSTIGNDSTIISRSCVYFNGNTYFFESRGACTDEKYDSDGTTIIPATLYYYGNGSNIKWNNGSTNGSISASATVYSLGITKDYLLAGTSSGIKHFKFDNQDTKGSASVDTEFATNADATMGSQYTVLAILVMNPEKKEYVSGDTAGAVSTTIYTSINYTGSGSSNSAQFSHIGLWAFYPSRGNWNCE